MFKSKEFIETNNPTRWIDIEEFEKKLDKQFKKDSKKIKRDTKKLVRLLNKLNKKTAKLIGKIGPIE